MESFHFSGLRNFIEALVNTSPIAMMMVVKRRVVDEGGLAKQMAIILIPSIITAGLTSGITAWATQAVMAEQIRQIREEVRYNRDVTTAAIQRIQDQVYAKK